MTKLIAFQSYLLKTWRLILFSPVFSTHRTCSCHPIFFLISLLFSHNPIAIYTQYSEWRRKKQFDIADIERTTSKLRIWGSFQFWKGGSSNYGNPPWKAGASSWFRPLRRDFLRVCLWSKAALKPEYSNTGWFWDGRWRLALSKRHTASPCPTNFPLLGFSWGKPQTAGTMSTDGRSTHRNVFNLLSFHYVGGSHTRRRCKIFWK